MEEKCKCPPPGLAPWMGTFADLMSLLMCFFVLLLSFSEMDVLKFKQIAGSMKFAFGVQNQLELKDIPKGTSVIAQEFRPGRPEPTPIEVIMQQTADITQRSLDFLDGDSAKAGGADRDIAEQDGGAAGINANMQQESESTRKMSQAEERLVETLKKEIEQGAVEVENLGQQLEISIREEGSFPAGSAFLQPKFRPLIRKITDIIKDVPGKVRVAGYTDNSPIDTELYRSNWDLSAQRAVSVAQEMNTVKGFNADRMSVVGMGANDPVVPNDSPENRSKNRRVVISVLQGEPTKANGVSVDQVAPIAPSAPEAGMTN